MFRRLLVAASVCGLAVGTVPALSLSFLASPAAALTPPGSFTSEDLPTWQADGTVWAMAASHGRVFVGGSFSAVRPPAGGAGSPTAATNLAVLDAATGDPISACSLPVTVNAASDPTTPTVRALTVSPDGNTVYVGGYFDHIDGQARQQLAAVDVDTCTVVSGFVPLPNALVRAIATNGNAVYFGGSITQVAGTARLHAAAVQAVGAASPGALLPWAPQLDQDVRAIGVRPDGSAVAVGGDFDTADGSASHAIAVVNGSDGSLLHAFSGGFIGSGSVAKTIVADNSGFYSGYEGTGSGSFDGRVAIDWGTYAERWRDLCLGATQALALENGVLYSGSHAHDCGQMNEFADGARHHLLAETVNSPALLSWYPNTNEGPSGSEQLGPRSLTVASSGGSDYLYVGGEFTSVNGHLQQSITRFGPGPDSGAPISAPTAPKLTVTSFRAGQIHVAWRPGIDSDDQNLTYQVFRDGSSTPIATQSAKPSTFWSLPQLSIDDTGLTSGSSHSYQVSVSDGVTTVLSSVKSTHVTGTTSAYASKIISDGAVAYWRYVDDQDVFVSDATTHQNSGDLLGTQAKVSPGAVGGVGSQALVLDGQTAFATPRQASPTSFSVETWFHATSGHGGRLIGFSSRPNGVSGLADRAVYLTNSGALYFGVNSSSPTTIHTAGGFADDQWHHVVATQGSGGMRLYVDGELLAQNAVTSAPTYTGFWRVGGDTLSGWPSRPSSDYFTGQLDETAVYPTALSSSAVAAHFQLGQGSTVGSNGPTDFYGRTALADDPTVYWRLDETTGTMANDSSGDSADGTYGSGVTLGQPTTVDGSAHAAGFNGTANGIVHSNATLSSSATFSAEAWVRTTTTTGGTVFGFADEATGTATTYDKQVWMDDAGHFVGGVDNGSLHTVTSPGTYNDGGWHHVALTQGGGGLQLYVDGALVDTDATTTSQQFAGFWRVGDTTLAGWPDASTSEALSGDIDEFASYAHVLTAAQVAAHHSAGDSGATDVAAPTTPEDFSVVQAGGGAKLSWDASLDNVGVTSYLVYRSDVDSPTVDNLVHTVAASAASVYSYTDTGLALGTWTYHVVAVDAASNASPPTDNVPVVVYDVVPPTAPTLSAAAGTDSVSLSWTASTDARGVTGYAVYRSATAPVDTTGSPLATTDSQTFSYEDAGLSVGATWHYAVVASDGSGNTATSNEVAATTADHVAPSAPNATLVATAGSATISWPASTDDVGVVSYRIYRRLASASTPTLLVTVSGSTLSHVDSPATTGSYVYQVSALDAAGNESDLSSPLAFTATKVADTIAPTAPKSPHAVVSGSQVTLTWLASTDNVKVVGYDVYRSKTSGFVPGASSLLHHTTTTKLVDPATPKGTWYYRVKAVDAAGNHSAQSSQVTAVVTKTLDTTRPVPPTVLKATVRTRTVTLSWAGAKDNTKVTRYVVYRGTSATFTPSTATQVTATTHLTASNIVPKLGTYYYRVIAVDAVGNKSQASIALRVVVGTHKSSTVLLTPRADSYVNEAAPTTNFGGESSMSSRGHLGDISYLSYALPSTPSGMKLTSVTLQLRTTTDSFAGSVGRHFVKLTTGSWTERGVTWKNRPKLTGSSLGYTPSHTLPNHAYVFHLSASALRSHAGHATTLALTSGGSDSLWFWSRQHPTPSYHPVLVLVYSPV